MENKEKLPAKTEGEKCPHCNGDGYTAEHDPNDPHDFGVCSGGCPIQVQCENCFGTGHISTPEKRAFVNVSELNQKLDAMRDFADEHYTKSALVGAYSVINELKRWLIEKTK